MDKIVHAGAAAGARQTPFDPATVLAAAKAHIRPLIEYERVILSRTSVTHMRRLMRLQHRFLTCLRHQVQSAGHNPTGHAFSFSQFLTAVMRLSRGLGIG